eukprot:364271-Chlamydomonas_euryale.AAC.16
MPHSQTRPGGGVVGSGWGVRVDAGGLGCLDGQGAEEGSSCVCGVSLACKLVLTAGALRLLEAIVIPKLSPSLPPAINSHIPHSVTPHTLPPTPSLPARRSSPPP